MVRVCALGALVSCACALAGCGETSKSGSDFVRVEPGTFMMGSPEDEVGRSQNEVQHEVTLTQAFELQRTEVTQAQWEAQMGTEPWLFTRCGEDCPVDTVSWWEALAYANAVSTAEGFPPCYTIEGCNDLAPGEHLPGKFEDSPPRGAFECETVRVNAPSGNPYACAGYRLPTEAEWEYAYRAGTQTPLYNGDLADPDAFSCEPGAPLDTNLDAIDWYCGNANETPHPVAQKQANAWGLYDMAGNVAEWCWDWHGDYPTTEATNPRGPIVRSTYRVNRGGSWGASAKFTRGAFRDWADPDEPWSLGFRLARSVGTEPFDPATSSPQIPPELDTCTPPDDTVLGIGHIVDAQTWPFPVGAPRIERGQCIVDGRTVDEVAVFFAMTCTEASEGGMHNVQFSVSELFVGTRLDYLVGMEVQLAFETLSRYGAHMYGEVATLRDLEGRLLFAGAVHSTLGATGIDEETGFASYSGRVLGLPLEAYGQPEPSTWAEPFTGFEVRDQLCNDGPNPSPESLYERRLAIAFETDAEPVVVLDQGQADIVRDGRPFHVVVGFANARRNFQCTDCLPLQASFAVVGTPE